MALAGRGGKSDVLSTRRGLGRWEVMQDVPDKSVAFHRSPLEKVPSEVVEMGIHSSASHGECSPRCPASKKHSTTARIVPPAKGPSPLGICAS